MCLVLSWDSNCASFFCSYYRQGDQMGPFICTLMTKLQCRKLTFNKKKFFLAFFWQQKGQITSMMDSQWLANTYVLQVLQNANFLKKIITNILFTFIRQVCSLCSCHTTTLVLRAEISSSGSIKSYKLP